MSVDEARKWLILASLSITGAQIVFLLVCPAFGFPLEFSQSLNLLQIVTPVFLGYLGSAAHFVFMSPVPTVSANNQFLGLMVRGPIIIYALAMVAAFSAFGYSNRVGATIGNGMSFDDLSTAVSISLGVLAVVTGIIVSYLFVSKPKDQDEVPTPH